MAPAFCSASPPEQPVPNLLWSQVLVSGGICNVDMSATLICTACTCTFFHRGFQAPVSVQVRWRLDGLRARVDFSCVARCTGEGQTPQHTGGAALFEVSVPCR